MIVTEWKCPECGSRVYVGDIMTCPKTTCYRCSGCDYHYDEQDEYRVIEKIAPQRTTLAQDGRTKGDG